MSSKYLTLTFVFEEESDTYGDFDDRQTEVWLECKGVDRDTNLTDDQLESLGEEIAQSDRWQIDRWNDIQNVMTSPNVTAVDW